MIEIICILNTNNLYTILSFHVFLRNAYNFNVSCKYRLIGLVGKVFANGPGDLNSIPGCVIPKPLKLYLTPPCLTLSNIRYVSKVKWSNQGKK